MRKKIENNTDVFIYKDGYLFYKLKNGTCNIHFDVNEGVALMLNHMNPPDDYYWKYVFNQFKHVNVNINEEAGSFRDWVEFYLQFFQIFKSFAIEIEKNQNEWERIQPLIEEENKYISIKEIFPGQNPEKEFIDYKVLTKFLKPTFKIPFFRNNVFKSFLIVIFNYILAIVLVAFIVTLFTIEKSIIKNGMKFFGFTLTSIAAFIPSKRIRDIEDRGIKYIKDSIKFTIFAIFDTIMVSNKIKKSSVYQTIIGYFVFPLPFFIFLGIIYLLEINLPDDVKFLRLFEPIVGFYWVYWIHIIFVIVLFFIFMVKEWDYKYLFYFFFPIYIISKIFNISDLWVLSILGIFLYLHIMLSTLIYPDNEENTYLKKLKLFPWIWQLFITSHFRIWTHIPFRILPGIIVFITFSPLILVYYLLRKVLKAKSALLAMGIIITIIFLYM